MTDLFDEVEEQLRSDRAREVALRSLPWVLGVAAAAIVAVLAYWGWDSYQKKTVSQASDSYAEAVDAMQAGDAGKARRLWTEVSKSQAKGYKSLSLMHLGAFAQQEGKPAEAVKLFDEAAKAAPNPLIGDAARLKTALTLLDTAPLKDTEARLKPLMEDGRPYRLQAREALGFAKLAAGDVNGARGEFLLIQQALDTPESLQGRAQAALALIASGSAKAIPAVLKAANAARPLAPAPITAPPPGAQPPQGSTQ